MVHVELQDLYKPRYAALWSLLSFKAGLLNTAGFLIVGSYVSHVTGFGTQIGLAIGHDDFKFGLELLVIPVSFISGGVITSLVLDRDYSKDKVPNYPIVQFLITSLIGAISLLFVNGFFETSSLTGQNDKSIILMGMLCLVCGLKNGLTTWASHAKIRTTHLTGPSTDIGLHLPKLFRKTNSNFRYPESRRVNFVRMATVTSFSLGSGLAAVLIPSIGHRIFAISFSISFLLLLVSVFHRQYALARMSKTIEGGALAT